LDFSKWKGDTEDIKKTIADALKSIQDNSKDTVKTINSQIDTWNDMLDTVSPALKKMGDDSIDMGNKIDSGAVKGTGFLEDAMGDLKNMFGSITGVMNSQVTPALDDVNSSIITNNNSLTNDLTPSINTNKNTWDNLEPTLNTINTSFGDITDSIDTGTTTWNNHTYTVKTDVDELKTHVDTLVKAVNDYTDALNKIPKQIATTITKTIYTTEYYSKVPSWMRWFGFQKGGIVTKPTPAIIGERGPEAVIPLDRIGNIGGVYITINTSKVGGNTDMIAREIADKFAFELSRVRY